MLSYKNEAEFVRDLMKWLKDKGVDATRIETGLTKLGVPDIYIVTDGMQRWIECKRIHRKWREGTWCIPFRPGQQLWAVVKKKLLGYPIVLCLVAFDDAICGYMIDKAYENRCVDKLKKIGGIKVNSIDPLILYKMIGGTTDF